MGRAVRRRLIGGCLAVSIAVSFVCVDLAGLVAAATSADKPKAVGAWFNESGFEGFPGPALLVKTTFCRAVGTAPRVTRMRARDQGSGANAERTIPKWYASASNRCISTSGYLRWPSNSIGPTVALTLRLSSGTTVSLTKQVKRGVPAFAAGGERP